MTRIKSAWKRIGAVLLAMLTCAALIPSMANSNLEKTSALADLPISQDMENNQVLDALAYLGYDVAGAKAAGNLWNVDAEGVQAQYLCSRDPSLYIRYNDAGADGYNKSNGLPNLALFRSAGLCCASFVTYVYFNYFETVAHIDTSALRQSIANHGLYLRGNFASDYYTIGEAWTQDGVARKLTASADANGYITWYDQNGNVTTPSIGTIIIYENLVDAVRPDGGVNHKGDVHHVSIYLGEKDGVQYVAQMGDGTNKTTGLDYGPRIHNLAETTKLGAPMAIRCAYDTTEAYGNLQVQKLSPDDGAVGGVTFNITGPNNFNVTAQTNSDGILQFRNITPGTYTVTEVVGENYVPQSSQTVTVTANSTAYASVTFTNTLKKGSLTVQKTAEDGFIKDVTFRLSGTSNSGKAVDVTAMTDAAGVATFNDIPIGTYTLTEIETGVQYIVPESQNVTIAWNEVTHADMNNELKPGSVKIIKTAEDGKVSGIKMNISGTNVIQQVINQDVVTGSDGIVQIDNLKPGTYTVTEYPSDAYVPQAPKTVTVKPGEVAEVEFYNKLERGNLRLIKTSEDGNVAGIKMNISGNGVNKDVVTGSNGTVLEEGLLPGTYTVTEYPSELYVPQDPQTVTVVKNQTAEVKFNNVLKRFTITGTKVSGDGEKLGGAIFGIYDASKVTSWDQATMDNAITTAESSDDGSFTLQSDNMICGDTTYVVYELKAPEGYDLSREVIWTGTNGNGATISLGNVINTTHPELPATGGSGESPIQSALAIGLIGCSLLGLGVIFYRVKKHKGEGDVKF